MGEFIFKKVSFSVPSCYDALVPPYSSASVAPKTLKNCGTIARDTMTYLLFEHKKYGTVASAELSRFKHRNVFEDYGVSLHKTWELNHIQFSFPGGISQDSLQEIQDIFLTQVYSEISRLTKDHSIRFVVVFAPRKKLKLPWPFIARSRGTDLDHQKVDVGLLRFHEPRPHILKTLEHLGVAISFKPPKCS